MSLPIQPGNVAEEYTAVFLLRPRQLMLPGAPDQIRFAIFLNAGHQFVMR